MLDHTAINDNIHILILSKIVISEIELVCIVVYSCVVVWSQHYITSDQIINKTQALTSLLTSLFFIQSFYRC